MDWSADNPYTSPILHVPLSEHVLSPRVPLSQGGSSSSNKSEMSGFN